MVPKLDHVAPISLATLDLSLRSTQRQPLRFEDYRGRFVLLYFFATFDGMSQVALQALLPFLTRHSEIHAIGISTQEDAHDLALAWEEALQPDFPVTYDPSNRLARGDTVLGVLRFVPAYFLIDTQGRECARHVGLAVTRRLELMRTQCQSAEPASSP